MESNINGAISAKKSKVFLAKEHESKEQQHMIPPNGKQHGMKLSSLAW